MPKHEQADGIFRGQAIIIGKGEIGVVAIGKAFQEALLQLLLAVEIMMDELFLHASIGRNILDAARGQAVLGTFCFGTLQDALQCSCRARPLRHCLAPRCG